MRNLENLTLDNFISDLDTNDLIRELQDRGVKSYYPRSGVFVPYNNILDEMKWDLVKEHINDLSYEDLVNAFNKK